MTTEAKTLAGRLIAVPETRELDVFTGLLERRGASVVRCPLVAIRDAPDPRPVLAWIETIIAQHYDDLILLTGEGLRRLISCIERNAPSLREPFIAKLAGLRKITRGPKPARALKELGLQSDLAPDIATTEGIISALSHHDMNGRRIGVQLYGADLNLRLVNWLREAGADVSTVAPYVYASSTDDESVQSLAKRMVDGEIDAIAFTSMQQVQRWFDVLGDGLGRASLAATFVSAIGPIVAESLGKRAVKIQLVPEDAYFLKPLTRALEIALGPKHR